MKKLPVIEFTEEQRQLVIAEGKDPSKYYLTSMCKYGHEFAGSGYSLYLKSRNKCVICNRESSMKYKEEHREQTLEYYKEYRQEHKQQMNAYMRNRLHTNAEFNLRNKINAWTKRHFPESLGSLGITTEECISYSLSEGVAHFNALLFPETIITTKKDIHHILDESYFNFDPNQPKEDLIKEIQKYNSFDNLHPVNHRKHLTLHADMRNDPNKFEHLINVMKWAVNLDLDD